MWERAIPVPGLLLQFRQNQRRFLTVQFRQESPGVKGNDAPGLQMFRPKVAKVESHDNWSLGVRGGSKHMTIFGIVGNLWNQVLVTRDPRIGKMVRNSDSK